VLLLAVDTNVLLDQALGVADVLDAMEVMRERLPQTRFIVTSTVVDELSYIAFHGDTIADKDAAKTALESLIGWGYEPLNIIPVGKGIAEQISFRLRSRGIIPEEEQNDAAIVAEAALIGCTILLSSDAHLLEAAKHPRFYPLLEECSVEGDKLLIAKPREIVRRFYRQR
jgi:rRNA-processing protein FCF1